MKISLAITALALTFACSVVVSQDPSYAADRQTTVTPQASTANQTMQPSKKPDIQAIKPKKPLKIKLHRSANGQYSWDISGDNADDVYRADSRLKKLLMPEQ
jgi:hypothetical protein